MDRRRFLAGTVLGGLGAYLDATLPAVGAGPAQTYRGTDDGRILRSANGGVTWDECADFGRGCRISAIEPAGSALVASVVFSGHAFRLYSGDGRSWTTAPRRPRALSRRPRWAASLGQRTATRA